MIARPLDATTWPDFAACVERNDGVWGGCWCMGFHAEHFTTPSNRDRKHERVCAGEGARRARLRR